MSTSALIHQHRKRHTVLTLQRKLCTPSWVTNHHPHSQPQPWTHSHTPYRRHYTFAKKLKGYMKVIQWDWDWFCVQNIVIHCFIWPCSVYILSVFRAGTRVTGSERFWFWSGVPLLWRTFCRCLSSCRFFFSKRCCSFLCLFEAWERCKKKQQESRWKGRT